MSEASRKRDILHVEASEDSNLGGEDQVFAENTIIREKPKKIGKIDHEIGFRCEFVIVNKNRRCGMRRKKDNRFCSEHMILEKAQERVPCPLDGKHTVWKHKLKAHLKKCNAQAKERAEPWFKLDCNCLLEGYELLESSSGDLELSEDKLFAKYLELVQKTKDQYEPLQFLIESHEGLDKRLSELEHQKHAVQQLSVAGNLKRRGLLSASNFYVEFGCGRAELSRFVNLCILKEVEDMKGMVSEKFGFGLIDRSVSRMKNDPKIRKETEEFNKKNGTKINPEVKRSRIDIKDLDLDKFLDDHNKQVVGISKHLCGVATDLTLKLIFNSSLIREKKLLGLMIAMCCRHVCQWDQLLPESQRYLSERGIDNERAFSVLKRLVSWAVSGARGDASDEHGLSSEARTEIGLAARRLIDESRLHAVKKLADGYECDICWYVERDVTLENVCLVMKRLQ